MKNPLFVSKRIAFIICGALFLLSCGDAGIGFNISKEVPIATTVTLNTGFGGEITESLLSYNLDDISAFDDALDGSAIIESIQLNELSYEIGNITPDASLEVDLFNFSISADGAPVVLPIEIPELTSRSKTSIVINDTDLSSLSNQLLNAGTLDTDVTLDLDDLADLPPSITMEIVIYVDVTIRARDL